jgi:hypothetical protein
VARRLGVAGGRVAVMIATGPWSQSGTVSRVRSSRPAARLSRDVTGCQWARGSALAGGSIVPPPDVAPVRAGIRDQIANNSRFHRPGARNRCRNLRHLNRCALARGDQGGLCTPAFGEGASRPRAGTGPTSALCGDGPPSRPCRDVTSRIGSRDPTNVRFPFAVFA